jgi:two-component system OmpR family sensor kinase
MMIRSIRWRLQLWYALVLLAVVAGNAALLYYRARSAAVREIDTELISSAAYVDSTLRAFPPRELEEDLGDAPRPPRDDAKSKPFPPPKRRPREALMRDLRLPDSRPGPPGRDERGFAVWRADGSLLKTDETENPPERPHNAAPFDRPTVERRPGRNEVAVRGPHRTTVLVWRSTRRVENDLNAFAWQLAGVGSAVLVFGLVGGFLVASRIFRPLAAISDTASRISATNLSERVAAERIDSELTGLVTVLNATFDRLESAFERQAQFTADASHELRTPLAVIRSQAELALMRPRSNEAYREALEGCHRAALRMSAIVDGLLVLARADAGRLDLRREPVDLERVVADGVDLIRPLARDSGVSIEATLAPAVACGDAEALARIVSTLLSNAVQYNRPGGSVRVILESTKDAIVLSVTDTGVGIAEEHRPHVFERFYRVDPARARTSGGTGLGLAICKSMAEAHGGSVEVESEPGVGSTFRVRLPAG